MNRRAARPASWLAGLLILVLTFPAAAWPGAGSMVNGSELTHAWVAIPAGPGNEDGGERCYLAHLPSRRGPPLASSGSKPAAGGAIRVAARLSETPLALAAVENRVYLVMEPATEPGAPAMRAVLSLAAVPAGIGDLWTFDPPDRLTAMAPLPAAGRLAGFAGGPRGPVALLDHGSQARPRFELLVLDLAGWRRLPLPSESEPGLEPSGLASIRGGVAVVLSGPTGPAGVWAGDWPAAIDRAEPVWTFQSFGPPPIMLESVVQTGGVWTAVGTAHDGRRVLGQEGGRWFTLAELGHTPRDFAAVPLDDVGRIALIWKGQPASNAPAPSGAENTPYEMREVSAWTGRIVYDGPARAKGPISWSDFRLLSLVLLGVMTLVLLIVVRSEPGGPEPILPEGASLAEPGHRWAAALIDALVCGCGALWMWDVPWRELANPAWIISARGEWALLTWLGLGFGLCTLTEAWFGLTPGKALTGSRVISVRPAGDRPPRVRGVGFRAALLRNAIKWMLPPVGAIGVLSPDSRHFGDVIAGTAVVVRPGADGEA